MLKTICDVNQEIFRSDFV